MCKCGALRVNELAQRCTCGGGWRESVAREEVVARLRLYDGVARFYGLRMLGDVAGSILEGL